MTTCPCTANVTGLPSVFVRGDTVRFQLCFTDDLGSAINISGWEIWFTLRDELDTPRERAFVVKYVAPEDADSLAGRAIVSLHSVDTARIQPGKYFYELKRILPDVFPVDVWTFQFFEKPNITVTGGVAIYEQDGTVIDYLTYITPAPGEPGPQGSRGASAYEIWLSLGNVGTEQDFIDSLQGSGGGGGSNPSEALDLTGNTYWYVRYSDRIARVDHSVAPPLVLNYVATINNTIWSNRQSLVYS